jgi:hypothetical protein
MRVQHDTTMKMVAACLIYLARLGCLFPRVRTRTVRVHLRLSHQARRTMCMRYSVSVYQAGRLHLKKCRQLALLGVKWPPSWTSTRLLRHASMSVWLRSGVTTTSFRPVMCSVGSEAGNGNKDARWGEDGVGRNPPTDMRTGDERRTYRDTSHLNF